MRSFRWLLLSLLVPNFAFASTYIVPNLARNKRDIHNSAAAAGWNTRNVFGLEYSKANDENKDDGVKDEENEESTVNPYAFYHTQNFTIEFDHETTKAEKDEFDPVTPGTKTDGKATLLNFGYVLPSQPMSIGFTLGASDSSEKDENAGTTDKVDNKIFGVSFSYKLPAEWYVGAGVLTTNQEDKPAGGPNDTDKIQQWHLGLGYIKGDAAKPELLGEGVLSFSNEDGLKTQDIIFQGIAEGVQGIEITGLASLTRYDGDTDGIKSAIGAGIDWQPSAFYLAPILIASSAKYEVDSTGVEVEETTSTFVLEGGYRANGLAVYGQVAVANEEADRIKPTKFNSKTEGSGFAVGLTYNY